MAFDQAVPEQARAFLRIDRFSESDGRAAEIAGVKLYEMLFTADVSVIRDALFSVTNQGMAGMGPLEGNAFTAQDYRDLSKEGLAAFFYASHGLRPARSGDRLRLSGSIQYEKRESGWVQTGMVFRADQDSSARASTRQAGKPRL